MQEGIRIEVWTQFSFQSFAFLNIKRWVLPILFQRFFLSIMFVLAYFELHPPAISCMFCHPPDIFWLNMDTKFTVLTKSLVKDISTSLLQNKYKYGDTYIYTVQTPKMNMWFVLHEAKSMNQSMCCTSDWTFYLHWEMTLSSNNPTG